MARAIWNGETIAESDETVMVEGNHYFPPDSVDRRFVRPSTHNTICGWKGRASYYDVVVGEQINANAAWFYPQPNDAAVKIRDHVAFWRGVKVEP